MDKKKRTFVQFFEDKQYLPTHSAVEAKGRDFEDLKLPEGCVALQFFDVYEVEAIDQDKTFLLKSEKVNKGPVTFVPGCTVYSVKEIQEQFPKEKYLLVDVTGNNCSGAVLSPRGQWHILLPGQVVL